MRFSVPEQLQTARLTLRQFRDEDWRNLHEYFSDAEATREFVWHCRSGFSRDFLIIATKVAPTDRD